MNISNTTTTLWNIKPLRLLVQCTLPALFLTLAACGESDLKQLQEDAIVEAQRNAPDSGPANPGIDNPDTQNPGTDEPERNKIDLTGYQLVFNENFDGTSINDTKWNTALKWGTDLIVNDEQQYYVDILNKPDFGYNPFRFDVDSIAIGANITPVGLESEANDQPYLSGVLTTADKFEFTYGIAEIRAQVPAGTGLWSQFWMLPSEFVDLKPQTFIMENKGNNPTSIYHSYKWHNSDDVLQASELFRTPGGDFSAGFHTYAVEWNPGELIFYIDGTEYQRFESEEVSAQAMYLIINLAVGGWFVGLPDNTTPFPSELIVDHVKVYQTVD